ncbi:xyloglucan galactosyltransferase KATAMARI1 homolog isoform X2 [Zea mays]|uniref:Exostosin GT47 domain-containing protein n=1 Tax=Zea mays TaxID=4577 RepID=A0A804LDI8_MAIZE|nr:xyloglucan galactosyltransferase KATAMARI1 homolog isoform X2 [Zea mays]|eukprot:XP_008650987.2 xyloglucan galactosyltransferase KATAMARI1 homolog isoform X2 [Zea mays]
MQPSIANSTMQLPAHSARKAGGSARSRRAVQSKGSCSLRNLAILAMVAWSFFLYLHFSLISGAEEVSNGDPCRGRYIYVYDLPPRFNTDIIRDCRKAGGRWADMCAFLSNGGLGRPLADDGMDGVVTGKAGWYNTHELALDAIFHNRMKQYECLTNRSAAASAVFVPFYAGFDSLRYRVGYDKATRDAASADLSFWLTVQPQWGRMAGRDHFLVAGRTGWDFRRRSGADANTDRGNGLLLTPAGRNMSLLVLESTLEHGSDFSVPYPTYFHPRSDADVLRWQARVRAQHRTWLMAFVGAPRRNVPTSTWVRDHVIAQCKACSACAMPGCARSPGSAQCHSPASIVRLFEKAIFCLQPPGDDGSSTRRSVFDSMVAGCIPVFFHTASAYKQYRWHLPRDDHLRYSVFIPDADVRWRNVSIEAVLRAIPPSTVERMREEVIRLIPTLLYADPRSKLETLKDAVDVAIEGILDTVTRIKNGEQVNCCGPVDKDPPNLFAATASRIPPKGAMRAVDQNR